jgi:hypothetical protein
MQNYILCVVAFFLPVFYFSAAVYISWIVSWLPAPCQEHDTQYYILASCCTLNSQINTINCFYTVFLAAIIIIIILLVE